MRKRTIDLIAVIALSIGLAGCRTDPLPYPMNGDASGGPADDGGGIADLATQCPAVFPQFDKRCTTTGDCVIAIHQTDCCGSLLATGIAIAQKPLFDAAEKSCRAMYPPCGCAPRPTIADDGRTATGPLQQVMIQCTAGQCLTSAP